MNKKQKIIRGHLNCTCDEAYKSRNMVDPNCFLCEVEKFYGEAIRDRIPQMFNIILLDGKSRR